jgi:hypothetical protein
MEARIISFLAAAAAGLTTACGGAFLPIDGSDGGDGGGGVDSGSHEGGPVDAGGVDGPVGQDSSSPWSPVCPPSAPAPGSSCTQQTVQCEYGGATWNVACDVVVQCENGVWTTIKPSFEACTPQPGPNPPECPASYAAVPQGATCAGSTSCTYPEAVCSCSYPLGGPPPPNLDGGINGYWSCVPEPGCPMPRPRLGAACSIEGTFCTYETCSYGQTCINGVWQSSPMACAQGGGAP